MSASSAHNVIRFEDCCRRKNAVNHPEVGSSAEAVPASKDKPNQSCRVRGLKTGAEFEDRLSLFERTARCRCSRIADALNLAKPSRWLDQMLDRHILPTLHRIGFDESISRVVFRVASSAWKLMGPFDEKVVTFHPLVDQLVEEVRQGIELKSRKTDNMSPHPLSALPQRVSGTIIETACPEYIFDLLDEITTPWIILPRAYHHLKKSQCCYLPVYLNTIDRETRESCLRLFSRIVVEFVGNFSLKFADRHHPPGQVAKLLFYGYSALFWKTLRCPPENMANSAVFDTFFNWTSMLARKSQFLEIEEQTALNHMRRMIATTFPARTSGSQKIACESDLSRFMVALRHGCIGVASILRYFGVDEFLKTRQIGSRFACPSIQCEVRGLLQLIQTNYHLEAKETREHIKLFIGCLRTAYALIQSDLPETAKLFLDRIFYNLKILTNN